MKNKRQLPPLGTQWHAKIQLISSTQTSNIEFILPFFKPLLWPHLNTELSAQIKTIASETLQHARDR